MKKLFACLLILLLVIPGKAVEASTALDQMRRASLPDTTARGYRYIDNFMELYYLNKPATRVAGFLYVLNQTRMLEDYPHATQGISAFMGVLFAENPDRVLEWLMPPPSKRGKGLAQPPALYDGEMAKMLQYAVWLSGRSGEQKVARLFEQKPGYLSAAPVPLMERAVKKEGDLDALWGAFLASGDEKYVGRIIDTACSGPPELQKAAAQSLQENAKSHELAARALRARIAGKPCDNIKPLLPKPLNLGKMDGEFSAGLLLANFRDSTKLMDGPIEAITRLPAVPKVHPGEKISVILTFSGMAISEDLNTDVDFDFVLIGPDGKPVEKSNIDRRRITPIKRSGRYLVYHPASFISLFFKEEYPAGTYKVKITIRDNTGKRQIGLQEQVEFVKTAP